MSLIGQECDERSSLQCRAGPEPGTVDEEEDVVEVDDSVTLNAETREAVTERFSVLGFDITDHACQRSPVRDQGSRGRGPRMMQLTREAVTERISGKAPGKP